MPRICINIPGENPQPYRFELEREKITIGRVVGSDLHVDCASVSSKHAIIRRVEGGYVVKDLDSTNGLKHAGTPMRVIDLIETMQFEVGDVGVDFQLSEEEMGILSNEEFVSHEQMKLPPVSQREESAEEEATVPKKVNKHKKRSSKKPQTAGGGMGSVLFLIGLIFLAGVAFFGGLSLKHQKTTGGGLFDLWNDLQGGSAPAEEAVTPPTP